jgi:hypothetical protein
MRDKREKGREAKGVTHGRRTKPEATARGERTGQAKLTDLIVRELRAAVASGERCLHVAKRLGVPMHAAYKAVKGHTWKHVA